MNVRLVTSSAIQDQDHLTASFKTEALISTLFYVGTLGSYYCAFRKTLTKREIILGVVTVTGIYSLAIFYFSQKAKIPVSQAKKTIEIKKASTEMNEQIENSEIAKNIRIQFYELIVNKDLSNEENITELIALLEENKKYFASREAKSIEIIQQHLSCLIDPGAFHPSNVELALMEAFQRRLYKNVESPFSLSEFDYESVRKELIQVFKEFKNPHLTTFFESSAFALVEADSFIERIAISRRWFCLDHKAIPDLHRNKSKMTRDFIWNFQTLVHTIEKLIVLFSEQNCDQDELLHFFVNDFSNYNIQNDFLPSMMSSLSDKKFKIMVQSHLIELDQDLVGQPQFSSVKLSQDQKLELKWGLALSKFSIPAMQQLSTVGQRMVKFGRIIELNTLLLNNPNISNEAIAMQVNLCGTATNPFQYFSSKQTVVSHFGLRQRMRIIVLSTARAIIPEMRKSRKFMKRGITLATLYYKTEQGIETLIVQCDISKGKYRFIAGHFGIVSCLGESELSERVVEWLSIYANEEKFGLKCFALDLPGEKLDPFNNWIEKHRSKIIKQFNQGDESNSIVGKGVCHGNCLVRHKSLLENPQIVSADIEMRIAQSAKYAHIKQHLHKQYVEAKSFGLTEESVEEICGPEYLYERMRESDNPVVLFAFLYEEGGHVINVQCDEKQKIFRFVDDNLGIVEAEDREELFELLSTWLSVCYPEYTSFQLRTSQIAR